MKYRLTLSICKLIDMTRAHTGIDEPSNAVIRSRDLRVLLNMSLIKSLYDVIFSFSALSGLGLCLAGSHGAAMGGRHQTTIDKSRI